MDRWGTQTLPLRDPSHPEIYQLATECQALGAELAKEFQNLSGVEAVHHTAAQATAHETINVGCMACNAAFSTITANQPKGDHEKFLCQFCAEVDQAWRDTNDVIFSHQLKYDAQLAAFITTVEGTLQAKWDEIWSHVHSIAEVAGLPNKACLTLALQILDKLPTLPLDLSYSRAIPRMLTYCPESYAFQAWSVPGDRYYLLDNNAQATCLLSLTDQADLDDPSPSRATSPAGSAMPYSPVHSQSCSCSSTPTKGGGGRSWSNSMSSLFSQGTQPESPTTSDPDQDSSGSSASEDDSESDGKGKGGFNDGASDSGSSSDDESTGSSESGSEEATDNKGAQQDSSENEGKGSSSETEGLDTGGSSSTSESTSSPPRCSHYLSWRARIQRRSRRPSSVGMPASWTKTLASGGTKKLVRASDNGQA